MPRKRDNLFLIIAEGLDQSVEPGKGWGPKHERARILAEAAPELLFLLKCLTDATSQDVFTDAPEYGARVHAAKYYTEKAARLIQRLAKKGVER
jgi:hypothetical protein